MSAVPAPTQSNSVPDEPRPAIVFAAAPVEPTSRLRLRLGAARHPLVVAADRGAARALAFGFEPDLVVGDLDSIDQATLAELRQRRVPIEVHPRDKDATDGQLAIDRALAWRPSYLLLIGFLGGPRLDQALASVLLLAQVQARAIVLDERNECQLVRPGGDHMWRTQSGEVDSLIPIGADVDGVSTRGLRWPLVRDRLVLGDTRGISNEPSAEEAGVSIARGLLLVTRHFPGN